MYVTFARIPSPLFEKARNRTHVMSVVPASAPASATGAGTAATRAPTTMLPSATDAHWGLGPVVYECLMTTAQLSPYTSATAVLTQVTAPPSPGSVQV